MQNQNGHAAVSFPGEGRKELVHKELARVYGAPLFLATVICFTLIQLLGIVSITGGDLLLRTLGMEGLISAPALIVAFVPNLVIAGGMWLVYFNAKTDAGESKYRVGFTMIQVVQFNQMVVMLIGVIIVVALGWGMAGELLSGAQELGAKLGLVLGAVAVMYYQLMMLVSVTLMKESAVEQSANHQVSVFAAILNIIAGGFLLVIQLRYSVDLSLLLGGAYAVLLGICMILYRVRMSRLSV